MPRRRCSPRSASCCSSSRSASRRACTSCCASGRTALAVGVLGVIFPFAAGFAAAELAGGDLSLAIFLAAALTATSVGITSNVLRDLGALTTTGGRIILGAAVIDDVLAIMILSVATGVAAGSFEVGNLLSLLVVAAAVHRRGGDRRDAHPGPPPLAPHRPASSRRRRSCRA